MDELKVDKMQGRWTVDSLYEHFTSLMREADSRYTQRFDAQEKAIDKRDAATEKRFESVNEFRSTLADQAKMLMPRQEAEHRANANADKITGLVSRMDRLEARLQNQDEHKGSKMTGTLEIVQLVVGLLTILAVIIGAALIVNK